MLRTPRCSSPLALVLLLACAGSEPVAIGSDSASATVAGPLELCINEFVADNSTGWQDENGVFADWIELHNPTATDVPLEGWFLTDDADDPWKHELGGVSVAAGGFLILVADDQPQDGPTHVSFALDTTGESLGLFRQDGVGELLTFGAVAEDFAWVRSPDCCADAATCAVQQWLGTPGASNAP